MMKHFRRMNEIATTSDIEGSLPTGFLIPLYDHLNSINNETFDLTTAVRNLETLKCQCGCKKCMTGSDSKSRRIETHTVYNIEAGGMIRLSMCRSCHFGPAGPCGPHVKSDDSQRYTPEYDEEFGGWVWSS